MPAPFEREGDGGCAPNSWGCQIGGEGRGRGVPDAAPVTRATPGKSVMASIENVVLEKKVVDLRNLASV